MAIYTVPEAAWQDILALSQRLQEGRKKIEEAWAKLAEELNFVATTVSVVDEEKGIIDAESRPSDEFIRQRRLLLVVDMLKGIPREDVELAAKLSTFESKLDLAQQLQLVQEGADAADAIQAEPEPVAESEGIMADNVINLLKN